MRLALESASGRSASRLRASLCRVTGAEPGELSRALWLFLYNFLVITAYLIIKPVRNSLFLERLGAENLPYAYIGTALFVGGACWVYFRLLDRLPRTGVVAATWSMLAGGLVAFWMGFSSGGVMISALFYFFSAAFAVVGVTQFWSFASEVLDARQARRLFGFVQAGGILGGLAGGVITGLLAQSIGTEQLLLVSAAICASCGALAVQLSRAWPAVVVAPSETTEGPEEPEAMAAAGGLSLVMASRYLLLICGMIFCFQMVSTLLDYQFHAVVEAGYPLKDARTAFYGTFFFVLNTASLLFQSFLTTRIHRRHGAGLALSLLPLAGLLGSTAFFLLPVFWVGVTLRASFGTLDYSLDRATRELLYLPTSRQVKYKAKAFLDMFCFRFFRCLAGILILFVARMEGLPVQNLSVAVILVSATWLLVALTLRDENVRQVRQALSGLLDPREPAPAMAARDRRSLQVEVGFELRRLLALTADAEVSPAGLARSHERLIELAGRLYGESDVTLALEALRGGAARRALALELLDGVSDGQAGRLLMRVLDAQRPLEMRRRLARRLLEKLGELPARPEPRQAWSAVGEALSLG